MQPTCSPTDVPPVSSSEGVVVMGGEGGRLGGKG